MLISVGSSNRCLSGLVREVQPLSVVLQSRGAGRGMGHEPGTGGLGLALNATRCFACSHRNETDKRGNPGRFKSASEVVLHGKESNTTKGIRVSHCVTRGGDRVLRRKVVNAKHRQRI